MTRVNTLLNVNFRGVTCGLVEGPSPGRGGGMSRRNVVGKSVLWVSDTCGWNSGTSTGAKTGAAVGSVLTPNDCVTTRSTYGIRERA
ncbi:hypothetical protein HanRHA438_Chr02g0088771 [Helianthus annuus]|nr:hypothetical protein HanRHA438_Chr02g0088771 [Helianthus annuus]